MAMPARGCWSPSKACNAAWSGTRLVAEDWGLHQGQLDCPHNGDLIKQRAHGGPDPASDHKITHPNLQHQQ